MSNAKNNSKSKGEKLQTQVTIKIPGRQPTEEEVNDPALWYQRHNEDLTEHLSNLRSEKAFLLEGKRTMSQEFLQWLYVHTLGVQQYLGCMAKGSFPEAEPILDWMLEERKKHIKATTEKIRLHKALLKRHEEDVELAQLRKSNNKKDGHGGNGGGNELVC